VAVDSSDSVYIGGAAGAGYAVTASAARPKFGAGGSDYERATAIALDAANNVYITGDTESKDFPVTPGAFQNTITKGHEPDAALPSFTSGRHYPRASSRSAA
jgi:hypothetical protein